MLAPTLLPIPTKLFALQTRISLIVNGLAAIDWLLSSFFASRIDMGMSKHGRLKKYIWEPPSGARLRRRLDPYITIPMDQTNEYSSPTLGRARSVKPLDFVPVKPCLLRKCLEHCAIHYTQHTHLLGCLYTQKAIQDFSKNNASVCARHIGSAYIFVQIDFTPYRRQELTVPRISTLVPTIFHIVTSLTTLISSVLLHRLRP